MLRCSISVGLMLENRWKCVRLVLCLSSYNQPVLADIPRPETDTPTLVVAAALLELFALRTQQPAPAWTRQVGPMEQPRYLLKAATHMRRLRDLCRDAAPEPLRRRHLYAPPDYLAFA